MPLYPKHDAPYWYFPTFVYLLIDTSFLYQFPSLFCFFLYLNVSHFCLICYYFLLIAIYWSLLTTVIFLNVLLYEQLNKHLTMTSHMLLCSNSPLIPIFPSEGNFIWHNESGAVSLILMYKDHVCTQDQDLW